MNRKCCRVTGFVTALVLTTGCASLTNDAYVPVALSFSNGAMGECHISNKRFAEVVAIPSTPMVRRSDDLLKYDCTTAEGDKAVGGIPSKMGGKS